MIESNNTLLWDYRYDMNDYFIDYCMRVNMIS